MIQIDMEIPKSCFGCPCNNGELWSCQVTWEDCDGSKRPEHCPLHFVAINDNLDEIIHCKDCKYHTSLWYCEAWNNSPGFPVVSENGYCWMAERTKKDEA